MTSTPFSAITFTTAAKCTAAILTSAFICSNALAQSASGLVSERSISTDAAMELASASLARCRADGYKVTVTVINRHARIAVQLSDDGVNPHTIENAYRKAYTAFTTRNGTVEMAKRTQPGLASFMLLANITALDGGVPIFAANKELVGAIGISGAPGGDKDTACALTGLEKIAGKL
jgi:uncharacterized protein GlcG (DUF336 family)